MKRVLIVITLLVGTTSCDAWDRIRREIQRSACTEDYRYISAESLEAINNSSRTRNANRFKYGSQITGNYNNDLRRSNQGGRSQMSIALSITNAGDEDISLMLSMKLQSEDLTYTPNVYRTCNSSKCPTYTQGGTARVQMESDSQENITYFFDLDLLVELSLDLVVEVGEEAATEPLINAEMIQVVLRSNCHFGGDNPGFEIVK